MYVLPTLEKCHFAATSFELWMSKGAYDVFALVFLFFGQWLAAKACDNWLIWGDRNYKSSLCKKFDRVVGKIWFKEKDNYLCKRWRF